MDAWREDQLHFAQVRCAQCLLLISQPQSDDHERDRYYGHIYFEVNWPEPDSLAALKRESHLHMELPLLDGLIPELRNGDGRSAVEIGCGYGIMLEELRSRGYWAVGCDLSQSALLYCRSKGLTVLRGKYPDLPFIRGSFDFVLSMHVVEHVAEPYVFAEALVSLLKPGGWAVIVTEDSWNTQHAFERAVDQMRRRIPSFRSSTDHTFLFNAKHLTQMLERAGCDMIRGEAFAGIPKFESLHWRLYKGAFRQFDRLLGRGEFLMVAGRRPNEPPATSSTDIRNVAASGT